MSKRQHPILVAYLLGKWFKVSFSSLIFVVVATSLISGTFIPYVAVAMLLLPLFLAIGNWYTFSYELQGDSIYIQSGIFKKEKSYIHRDRIQTIHTRTPILFRLFGFTSISIETAGGGGEPEVTIQGIEKEEAEKIIQLLNWKEPLVSEKKGLPQQSDTIFSFSKKELLLGAITSGELGIVLLALGAVYDNVHNMIPRKWEQYAIDVVGGLSYLTWIVAIIFIVIVSWFLSLLLYSFKYANFQVKQEENGIRVLQGLLETKEFLIQPHRVQSIVVKENFVRRALGYCTISLEVIGSTGEEKEKQKLLVPFIKKEQLQEVLTVCFPEYECMIHLENVSKEAKGFYYRSNIIWITMILASMTIGISWYFQLFILLWLIAIFPLLGFWRGRREALHSKYGINEKQLTLTNVSLFSYRTIFVMKPRVQSLTYKQNIFQKRKEVSNICVHVASTEAGESYSLSHIDKKGRECILNWFQESQKKR